MNIFPFRKKERTESNQITKINQDNSNLENCIQSGIKNIQTVLEIINRKLTKGYIIRLEYLEKEKEELSKSNKVVNINYNKIKSEEIKKINTNIDNNIFHFNRNVINKFNKNHLVNLLFNGERLVGKLLPMQTEVIILLNETEKAFNLINERYESEIIKIQLKYIEDYLTQAIKILEDILRQIAK